jgi:nitroreductase
VVEQQDWVQVVAAATRAPSIHNSQPWRFTASPARLDVFLDRDRALPVLDPTSRQQVISCGIAIEFAVVALAARGWASRVTLAPGGPDSAHLATLELAEQRPATDEDAGLAAAIDRRHTVRAPFLPKAVPTELIDRMQAMAGRFGTWVKPITREEEEVATAFLISRAEEIEQSDPAYLAELESWMRTEPGAVDGVPLEAVTGDDPRARPSNWLIRDFMVGHRERHEFQPPGDPAAPPPEVERPTVVLMGTGEDDLDDWLEAGRALGRVLLLATVEGLAASPLTQALDWPATRSRLQQRLSLVGHPQFLLRMGYPPDLPDGAVSGRRPVAEVLDFG